MESQPVLEPTLHISADDVQIYILDHITPVASEITRVDDCLNRIPAEDILSEVNIPGYTLSAMDGFAVRADDVITASNRRYVVLKVVDDIRAGDVSQKIVSPGTAARIMTGAPMPAGADSVVPFEFSSERIFTDGLGPDEIAVFQPVSAMENVRQEGSDIHKGNVILQKGKAIRPQDMGVLASVGRVNIPVYRFPRVAIIPTGNEMVSVESSISYGKVRTSNPFMISGMVQQYGAEPVRLGIVRDSVQELIFSIKQALTLKADLVLTSAGTSNGDCDLLKDALKRVCREHFWQAEIKPGKTMTFGMVDGVPVIGLPGNPGAAAIAFELFARSILLKLAGHTTWCRPVIRATLTHDLHDKKRHHLIPAVLSCTDGYFRVETSGNLCDQRRHEKMSDLLRINAFLDVPRDVTFIPAGAHVDVRPLDGFKGICQGDLQRS